ncbi:MAG: SDR family NAD(P)-dependent oxidoreductase [Sphaerochaetaceae bacterium]
MSFQGKTVVVTGAGSGIGQAIAFSFAKDNANVALLDINADGLATTQKIIESEKGKFLTILTDITQKEEVFTAAELIKSKMGQIDHWVNCAGYSKIIPFLEHSEEIWDRTLDINLKGTFFCCQAAVTSMLDSGGSIVNFSSQSGKKGTNNYAAYCASKFGIIGLTQSIAVEFAPHIRCNCICPGVVPTPMWDKQLADYANKRQIADNEVMDRFIKNTPMQRLCEYDDIINLVKFLLGEESSYMTGQSLNLTGGACMH